MVQQSWQAIELSMLGTSGGLTLLWDKNMSAKFVHVDKWIIHVCFKDMQLDKVCHFTGIYVVMIYKMRELQWQVIKTIKPNMNEEQVYSGDLNCVMDKSKKLGGSKCTRQMI